MIYPLHQLYIHIFACFKEKELGKRLIVRRARKVRTNLKRDSKPTAASVDSQSVKTTPKRGRKKALMEEKRSKEESVIFWLIAKD